jgi:hypothetical protein
MYRDHDYGQHPELSRRAVLEDAFHIDDKHPLRRAMFEIGLAFMPLIAVAVFIGVVLLVGAR